jgi:hypothetical protein
MIFYPVEFVIVAPYPIDTSTVIGVLHRASCTVLTSLTKNMIDHRNNSFAKLALRKTQLLSIDTVTPVFKDKFRCISNV